MASYFNTAREIVVSRCTGSFGRMQLKNTTDDPEISQSCPLA